MYFFTEGQDGKVRPLCKKARALPNEKLSVFLKFSVFENHISSTS